MAKISARGATKIVEFDAEFTSSDLSETIIYHFVVRSDGKVLRKVKGPYGSGYLVVGVVSLPIRSIPDARADAIERFCSKMVVK